MNSYLTLAHALTFIALIIFVLAALSVALGTFTGVALVAAGLAFLSAGLLAHTHPHP